MLKEDLRICWRRYSTSKIQDEEDIYEVATLGFRGEAFSSISTVSRMRIISKTELGKAASELFIEGGQQKIFRETHRDTGTTV